MGWFSIFRASNRTDAFELIDTASQYEACTTKEVLAALLLCIVGYAFLATPIQSVFASFHLIELLSALRELRHVRSTADARLWWNQLKHDNNEREQKKRWQTLLRSSLDAENTIRASNGNSRSIPHLQSLFPLNKLHNSSSDGYLTQSPRRDGEFSSEDEFRDTNHDRFERAWKSYIHNAEYKQLVLPPECKLVDSNWKENNENKTSIHESSWQRMVAYVQNLYGFWAKLFSLEGFKGFLLWVMDVIRYKLRKRRGLPVDEDDEEDDDGSIETIGTPKASMKKGASIAVAGSEVPLCIDGGKTPRIQGSSKKNENDSSIINIPSLKVNEKQDKSNLHPRKRFDTDTGGDDDTFISAAGVDSSDRVTQSLDIPLTVVSKRSNKFMSPLPALAFNKTQQSPKKKDALESYRQHHCQTSIPLPVGSPKANAQVSPIPSPKVKRSTAESVDMNFFDTAHSKSELRDLTREVPIPDANGFILGDEFIDASTTPLLVFVNSRSGPQTGSFLITQFKRLLNPIQVWDLEKCAPEKILTSFSRLSRVQVLVCGGDGTVSWVINVLEKLNLTRWPPIAILPLGTGNDLARVHGWGGGYNNESLLFILRQISQAYVSMLDLWMLDILDRKGRRKEQKSFINYLGVGVDAQAALQVHNLRESTPKLFFSRFYNKGEL